MAARALIVLPIFTIAVHSGYVYNVRRKKIQQYSVEAPLFQQRAFRPAETNEVLTDALHTGDIVLFKRKWYLNYLPFAAAIVAYRSITKSEFDHAGVILVDKLGTAWILERSFLSGMVCRKFADRLKYSQSELISLIPLLPRNIYLSSVENSKSKEASINPTNIVAKLLEEGDSNSSELLYLTKFIIKSLIQRSSNPMIGPHVDLMQRFYHQFQIDLLVDKDQSTDKSGEKVLDLKLVEERRIKFQSLQGTRQQQQLLQLSKQNINIQTR
jgi:hypothetical protein